MSASNIHFQMDEPSRAVNHGSIDAMHLRGGQASGLTEKIDACRGDTDSAERRVGLLGQLRHYLYLCHGCLSKAKSSTPGCCRFYS
jgi:hypothetical protein